MTKLLLALFSVLALFAAACGGDDDNASPTANGTQIGSTTATAAATATPAAKQFASQQFAPGLTLTADDSWAIDYDGVDDFTLKHTGDATTPTGYAEVFVPSAVFSADGLSTEAVPTDLAAWVRSYARLIKQTEAPVTVSALSGVQFDVASSGDAEFGVFGLTNDSQFEMRFNDRVRMTVLHGTTGSIVVAEFTESAPNVAKLLPIADPIVQSIHIMKP